MRSMEISILKRIAARKMGYMFTKTKEKFQYNYNQYMKLLAERSLLRTVYTLGKFSG